MQQGGTLINAYDDDVHGDLKHAEHTPATPATIEAANTNWWPRDLLEPSTSVKSVEAKKNVVWTTGPIPENPLYAKNINNRMDGVSKDTMNKEMEIAEKKFSAFENHLDEYLEYVNGMEYTPINPWSEPSDDLKNTLDVLIPYLNSIPVMCAVRAVKLYSGIKLIPGAVFDPESYNRYEESDWDKNCEAFHKVYRMRGYKNADTFFTSVKEMYTLKYDQYQNMVLPSEATK